MSRDRSRIDPEKIREALAALDASTYRQASIDTGFNVSTLVRWANRRHDEGGNWPTDEYIAAWKADDALNGERRRIKAEKNADYRKRAYLYRGNLRTPAIGTARRLQALYALGWTQRDMADRLGVSIARVHHLITARRPTVQPATVKAVAEMFDEWCMTIPADTTQRRRGQTKHHARARKHARKLGFAPPLAWDDIDNDPAPMGIGTSRTDRADVLADVDSWGGNATDACRALGIKRDSLQKWAGDNGCSELYRRLAGREAMAANQYAKGDVA